MSSGTRQFNAVAVGRLTGPVDDSGNTPAAQVNFHSLQTIDGVQLIQHFGFSSSPPLHTKVVVVCIDGDKSRPVILGSVEGQSRRKGLLTNETVVYDGWGNEVHLSQAGVTVKHAALVTIDAPGCTVKAPDGLRVEGPINCTGEVTAFCDGAFVKLSPHTHAHGAPPDPDT